MEKDKNLSFIWAGLIGGAVVIAIVIIMMGFAKVFDYRAVYIVHPEKIQVDSQGEQFLHMSMPEYKLLKSMRDKELLLTPAEYTNNLVGYYNTLIAFLSIFFLVFTIAGYFYVRNLSKAEVRKEAVEIIKDSRVYRDEVLSSIRGEFDGQYVLTEVYSELEERVADLESVIEPHNLPTVKETVKKRPSRKANKYDK